MGKTNTFEIIMLSKIAQLHDHYRKFIGVARSTIFKGRVFVVLFETRKKFGIYKTYKPITIFRTKIPLVVETLTRFEKKWREIEEQQKIEKIQQPKKATIFI